MNINYYNEDIIFKLNDPSIIENKLKYLSQKEQKKIKTLNFIFCSDTKILEINKQYLNHDYFTDIITFDQSEENGPIESDVFISIDRVKENATTEKISFENELERIMLHGVLHLTGYKDTSPEDKKIMTEKEDFYLSYSSKN